MANSRCFSVLSVISALDILTRRTVLMEGRKSSTMLKYFDATPNSATAWVDPKDASIVIFAWLYNCVATL